jgi:DNA-binding LacI/PurR family transcriptional regulator
MQGFHAAIEAKGLEPGPFITGDDNWSCESGYQAMQSLLAAHPRPTAVFAANDRMAIGAMRAILKAGLRVPEDISVVGVDDIEFCLYQSPPLTTVRQSLLDVATLGIKILLEILDGKEPAQSQVAFEPMLVVRSSSGKPSSD